jgi:hypothetical protein
MSLLDVDLLEQGIAALSVRLKAVEDRVGSFEERVGIKERLIKETRKRMSPEMAAEMASQLSPLCDKVARIEAEMGLKTRLTLTKALAPTIEVPQDLRMIPGQNGKKKNRTAEVVQRRWEIWKMQREAGITTTAIARAWGCDHASILYAEKKNWKVGDNKRKVEYQRGKK